MEPRGPITLQEVIENYQRQQNTQKLSTKPAGKQAAAPMRK